MLLPNIGQLSSVCALLWTPLGALLLLLSVAAETRFESRPESTSGVVGGLGSTLADLTEHASSYLGKLGQEQMVISVQKAFSQVLGVAAEGLAAGFNVFSRHASRLLQAAGVGAALPLDSVTPEGVVFVVQWLLLALLGYWAICLLLRCLAQTLRMFLWLLKVGAAVASFALILSDRDAATETTAVRLAVLVFVCALLGVGRSRGGAAEDTTSKLEKQVKLLERKVREMEGLMRDGEVDEDGWGG